MSQNLFLEWQSSPVNKDDEAAYWECLMECDEEALCQCFIAQDMPYHHGLSVDQATNLLRLALREKMGEESFYEDARLGTKEGAKLVGTAFEKIVTAYLVEQHISFTTEEELKDEFDLAVSFDANKELKKKKERGSRPFRRTGEFNTNGKEFFSGPCDKCENDCKVPFKPVVLSHRKKPVLCNSCFRPVGLLTPDFLFKEAVWINGKQVHWMDCKCFFGCSTQALTVDRIIHQAGKYANKWGYGAIVFAFGFSSGLVVQDAVLLDASPLEVNSLNIILKCHPAAASTTMMSTVLQHRPRVCQSKGRENPRLACLYELENSWDDNEIDERGNS